MNDINYLAALVAGLVSFLSPCVLPLVPVYLASLAGPGILNNQTYDHRNLFFHSLSFVLGFGVMFTAAGALVGIAGITLNPNSLAVRMVSGSILLLLGIFMLLALKIPALNYEARLKPRLGSTTGYLRSILTGASFSLAWTPCLGPVLGGILTLAFNSSTALDGASLLAVYSLGLGIPFLILGLAFDRFFTWFKVLKKYSGVIYIVSGSILIIAGVLILTGNLGALY